MTNTDNKGVVRPVDEYTTTDFGLYMARPADHPRFSYLESWLLPRLSMRANIFHFVPGHRADQRLYIDIGQFSGPDEQGRWHAEDWYLDLVDRPGSPLQLVDVDELFEAHLAGHLRTDQCEKAVTTATSALAGAAADNDDVESWLADCGAPLTWRFGPRLVL